MLQQLRAFFQYRNKHGNYKQIYNRTLPRGSNPGSGLTKKALISSRLTTCSKGYFIAFSLLKVIVWGLFKVRAILHD